MKQILFLLLLFPCLCLAQYTGNANQKITLGEQSTADGLVYRGVASADTTRKPSIDTMAFILLDTTTNILWQYKKATNNAWTRLGGSISSGVTGVLPVANGGTGSASQNFVDLSTAQTVAGAKTFTSAVTATRFNPTANTVTGTGMFLPAANSLGFTTNGVNKMTLDANGNLGLVVTPSAWLNSFKVIQVGTASVAQIANRGYFCANWFFDTSDKYIATDFATMYRQQDGAHQFLTAPSGTAGNPISFTQEMTLDASGRLGIGTTSPDQKLHVDGNARITAVAAMGGNSATLFRNSDGVLSTSSSDINKKHNVKPIIYGLNTINKLNPVNFQWNVDESEDIGFIAQDIQNIIPESIETDWNSDLIFKYEKLIPVLVKAIQEQQALIKALEQRLLILENK